MLMYPRTLTGPRVDQRPTRPFFSCPSLFFPFSSLVLGFLFWVLGFGVFPASPFISSTIDKAQEAALRSASVRTLDLSFPVAFAIGSSYHVHSRACPVSIDGYVVKGRPKVKILKLRIQLVLVVGGAYFVSGFLKSIVSKAP